MLSALMYEIGQLVTETCLRAQIACLVGGAAAIHPQRRLASKPRARHMSHFHAAWFEN